MNISKFYNNKEIFHRDIDNLNDSKESFSPFQDEFGNPAEKTKYTNPYNYSPFVIWRTSGKSNDTTWTDRLYEWNYRKYNMLCKKYFGNEGQLWADRKPELIEKWLRDYFNKPNLKLVMIMEYCNPSNGFPLWRFDMEFK